MKSSKKVFLVLILAGVCCILIGSLILGVNFLIHRWSTAELFQQRVVVERIYDDFGDWADHWDGWADDKEEWADRFEEQSAAWADDCEREARRWKHWADQLSADAQEWADGRPFGRFGRLRLYSF